MQDDEKNKKCHSCEGGNPESDGSSGLRQTSPKDETEGGDCRAPSDSAPFEGLRPLRAERQDGNGVVGRATGDECQNCGEYLAGWKRAQADYANLKREFEQTKKDIASYANENLLYELLPAVDQFEIALQHLPNVDGLPSDQKKQMQNWLTGIVAVKQMWVQTFKLIGLENVNTDGEFDPSKHEAVSNEEDDEKPPNTILKVIQQGWMLNGKVLRPAKVVVNSINN
ncbi:MAG: nucleotide exchange factor GrpE [Patescibacteria group bacterium]|nr:nucleotide exchange factor GrpE [Patescibacteria group bacterium]